VSISEPYIKQR